MLTANSDINTAYEYLYSKGRPRIALKFVQKAYDENPKDLEAIHMYAVALYYNKQYKNALKYFYIVENAGKSLEEVYVYIAKCHSLLRENLFLGLKYINNALENYNFSDELLSQNLIIKGEIMYKLGEIDTALGLFLEAHELGDMNESLCYISQIYFEKNQQMLAIKYFYKIFNYADFDIECLSYEEIKALLTVSLNQFETSKYKKTISKDLVIKLGEKIFS